MKKIIYFILRLVTLPFILGLYTIARIRDAFTLSYCYLKQGGEFIIYSKKINPKTIYKLLEENLEKRNLYRNNNKQYLNY